MKNLIKRNYKSTVKRGKITNETTHYEFSVKINEEKFELDTLIYSNGVMKAVKDEPLSKHEAIECTDIILTCMNYLTHSGYDVIELMEEKISINEQRKD